MTVHTHPTATQASGVVEATPTTGPVARIVAGSLAAGAAAALVLTLVVFPGGTEGRITGSLLVGFGFGWALLAALTGRYTNRPQRWAAVPAAVMAATGLALLAFTPDNDAMTRLNWVWPPVMLALAVWMFARMRRTLPRRGRWLLTPVVGVLALASVGATYENITLVRDQNTYAAPGTLYDVGDHRLHLDCHGHGGPTVVLFNGMGEISAPLGPDRRPGGRDHPGVRLRPRRPGLERRRRPAPGRHRGRPRTCTPCWPRPARPAPTCWPGTPPAAPTR